MSDLISITLLSQHRIRGKMEAKDVQCDIHRGVADDLVNREIAVFTKISKNTKLKNEPTEAENASDGGE
tara:strand:- start:60 stop:266 length:207 start_codon:yes stop_codon:yes gene_type:complete